MIDERMEVIVRKYLYILGLAAKSAARRSAMARGVCLVFAAAAALAVTVDAVQAGASRNALSAFERRSGGTVFVRGLERDASGRLVEMGERSELAGLLATMPAGSVARERCDFRARVIAHGGRAYAMVRGIDMESERDAMRDLHILAGSASSAASGEGIVLEEKAAVALGLSPGDEVLVETTDCRGRATAEAFKVAAIARDPSLVADGSAWLELKAARLLRSYGPGELDYLAIVPGDPARDSGAIRAASPLPLRANRAGSQNLAWDDVASRVEGQKWEGRRYLVVDAGDSMVFTLRALAGIKAASAALIAAILGLGAVGASSSFGMIALDRRRETGALRAIGLGRREAARMAAAEAVITAAASSVAGIAAGSVVVLLLSLVKLPNPGELSPFLADGSLSPILRPQAALAAFAASVAAAGLGSIGPARSAGRAAPAAAFGEGI
jgi:ABC-type lipoprotein release transport system permease subunit